MDCEETPYDNEQPSVCTIPSIEVHDLFKGYGSKKVLDGVSVSICPGETLAVIGPSGTGKSTFLKILSGLEDKDSGKVEIHEENIGMVFQYSALLNSCTIGENIAFALHDSKLSDQQKKEKVMEKLEVVGLSEYYDLMPAELSGGQQKRASFARAVVNDPKIILYDEPTAGLDPITSTIVEDYMNKLSRCEHTTGVVVTHQHSTIRRTADRVICLNKGQIVWEGIISEIDSVDNPYIRQFMDGKTKGPFTDGNGTKKSWRTDSTY